MRASRPLRYLVVGAINTVFGYFATIALYYTLSPALSAFAIGLVATVLNVSFSFTSYKLFVFRTKSAWLPEYFRSFLVYGGIGVVTSGALWFLVERMAVSIWLAQGLLTILAVGVSYLAHANFTFRQRERPAPIGDER